MNLHTLHNDLTENVRDIVRWRDSPVFFLQITLSNSRKKDRWISWTHFILQDLLRASVECEHIQKSFTGTKSPNYKNIET